MSEEEFTEEYGMEKETLEDLYDNMNDEEKERYGFITEEDIEEITNGLIQKYNEMTGSHCKNKKEFAEDSRKREEEFKNTFENKVYLINPKRYSQLLSSYSLIKSFFKGRNDVLISLKINKLMPCIGNINLKGNNIFFKNANPFLKIAKLADQFYVCTNCDNTVTVSFTFLNIATEGSD